MLAQTPLQKLPDKLGVGKSFPVKDGKSFYASVLKLCQLEGLDVLCLNCDWESPHIRPVTPSKELVSTLFKSYVKQWRSYSEHYLLYYLYQQPQVKSAFTLSDLLQVAVPDLLARANQLEQDAPTLYVPENESEQSIGQHYKPGDISPMPNKNPAEQYSPELLKHFPKAQRSGQGQAPFRLNLIDLPGQQESMTVMSAGPFD